LSAFAAHESTLTWLRSELAAKGPLAASEIEHDANRRSGPWWGWSEVKRALERMFLFGEVAIAGRTRFQRRYGLVEDVLPASVLDRTVSDADAIRELMRRSAVAHGIGTVRDFADYYRLKGPAVAVALQELEDAGEVIPVQVKGWNGAGDRPLTTWLHRDARKPRSIETAALLSPFDPVVWFRDRAPRVFGFHYRIEVHPAAAQPLTRYYPAPTPRHGEAGGRGARPRGAGGRRPGRASAKSWCPRARGATWRRSSPPSSRRRARRAAETRPRGSAGCGGKVRA